MHENPFVPVNINILYCACENRKLWNYSIQRVPFWRVYWNDSPGWHIEHKNQHIPLGPDRLVVIPPDTQFVSKGIGLLSHLYIHFSLDTPFSKAKNQVITFEIDGILKPTLERLISHREALINQQPLQYSSAAYFLCFYVLQNISETDIQVIVLSHAILEAMDLIQNSLEFPLHIQEVAKKIGLSRNTFSRKFLRETGYSPQQWYLKKRIEQACMLLHHTKMSLDEIAEQTGFCDRAHFSHMFKKIRNQWPARFRSG